MQHAVCRRALGAALGIVLALIGAGMRAPMAAAQGPAGPAPDLRLGKIHMVETRDGATLWELWADRAEVREREGSAVLLKEEHPVRIVLYAPQGELTCTTNRVVIDLPTKDVRLEGAVVARTEQGAEVRTESLRWVAATRRLTTEESVTVSRGGLVSRGRGMEADTILERVRLFRNITSHVGGPEVSRALQPPSTGRGRVR
jgi:LPS export ABC transporter protein LptC